METSVVALLQFLLWFLSKFLLWFLSTGALIGALILLLLALIQAAPAMGAREWARANGIIVKAFISTQTDDENAKAKLWYVPQVSYTYFARGAQYVAQRVHFGAPLKRAARDRAEQELARWPIGARVTVPKRLTRPFCAVKRRTRVGWVGWLLAFWRSAVWRARWRFCCRDG